MTSSFFTAVPSFAIQATFSTPGALLGADTVVALVALRLPSAVTRREKRTGSTLNVGMDLSAWQAERSATRTIASLSGALPTSAAMRRECAAEGGGAPPRRSWLPITTFPSVPISAAGQRHSEQDRRALARTCR